MTDSPLSLPARIAGPESTHAHQALSLGGPRSLAEACEEPADAEALAEAWRLVAASPRLQQLVGDMTGAEARDARRAALETVAWAEWRMGRLLLEEGDDAQRHARAPRVPAGTVGKQLKAKLLLIAKLPPRELELYLGWCRDRSRDPSRNRLMRLSQGILERRYQDDLRAYEAGDLEEEPEPPPARYLGAGRKPAAAPAAAKTARPPAPGERDADYACDGTPDGEECDGRRHPYRSPCPGCGRDYATPTCPRELDGYPRWSLSPGEYAAVILERGRKHVAFEGRRKPRVEDPHGEELRDVMREAAPLVEEAQRMCWVYVLRVERGLSVRETTALIEQQDRERKRMEDVK